MAKGDDAVRKRKNKNCRKRLRSAESTVSNRVASIIAAKRRRKTGKRRRCEGMCFSLPTPEDPFNDLHNNKKKTVVEKKDDKINRAEKSKDLILNIDDNKALDQGCPSKLLVMCLNAIQEAWMEEGDVNVSTQNSLLLNSWGVQFWKKCYSGSSILDTCDDCASREKVAWLVSAACDRIARKEQQGELVHSPFLLFIVPTQEKAIQVRSVCKPLKAFGIHTVSLHPGAPLDHQVHGLKSCEPEFLVSTPERLLELVSLKAIDVSVVSLLVIDGLTSFQHRNFIDKLEILRESIPGNPQVVIFSDCYDKTYASIIQNLVRGPVSKISEFDTLAIQSAFTSEI